MITLFRVLAIKSVFRQVRIVAKVSLRLCVAVAASLCLQAQIAIVHAQAETTIEDIIEKWNARGENASEFRITWDEHELRTAGSYWPMTSSGSNVPTLGKLEHDVRTAKHGLMSVSGDRMRYDFSGNCPSSDYKSLEPQIFRSSFDGDVSKILYPDPPLGYPCGFVISKKAGFGSEVVHTRPIVWALCPLNNKLGGIDQSRLHLGENGIIDGVVCRIIQTSPESGLVEQYWADQSREFIILRSMLVSDAGQVLRQTDINYVENGKLSWVPSAWKFIQNGSSGTLTSSISATVLEITAEPQFPTDEFIINFPYGTVVTDSRNVDERGRGRNYIVIENGEERPILDSEHGIDYATLLHSTPHRTTPQDGVSGFLIANVLLIGFILAILLIRRRRIA